MKLYMLRDLLPARDKQWDILHPPAQTSSAEDDFITVSVDADVPGYVDLGTGNFQVGVMRILFCSWSL